MAYCSAEEASSASESLSGISSKKIWFLIFVTLAVAAGIMGIELSVALPALVDKFIYDDAFYYFQTAYVFARSGFSSFDGINFTNGYHPLWFLVSSFFYLFFESGSEIGLRFMLALQGLCTLAGIGVLLHTSFRIAPPLVGLMGFLVFFSLGFRDFINGLETGVATLFFALLVRELSLEKTALSLNWSKARLFRIGLLISLLALSRTDHYFIALFYGAFCAVLVLREKFSKHALQKFVYFIAPLVVLLGGYLLINYVTTGHLTQVSGAAKVFYSGNERKWAMEGEGFSLAESYVRNFDWMFESLRGRMVFFFSCANLLLLFSILLGKRFSLVSTLCRPLLCSLSPLILGLLASVLYYHINFFGSLTKTSWYYQSLFFSGIFIFAFYFSRAKALDRLSKWPRCLWGLVGAALGVGVVWLIYHKLQLGIHLPLKWLHWGLVAVGVLLVFRRTILAYTLVLCMLAYPTFVPVYKESLRKPWYWNYGLYRGALWLRDNAPKDAVVWGYSSGVLGYFSGRSVVNTDGLINSYEYLENILKKGETYGWVKQFDYTADAYGVPTGLDKPFPEGCEIELPKEIDNIKFHDGSIDRKLAIFKMKKSLPGKCKGGA